MATFFVLKFLYHSNITHIALIFQQPAAFGAIFNYYSIS